MNLKIGIGVLVIGVMFVGGLLIYGVAEARPNIPSWAVNALKAIEIFDAATDRFFVSVGADIRNPDGSSWGQHKFRGSSIPWVERRYRIIGFRAEYSGYAGFKWRIPIVGSGGRGTHYTGVCNEGILVHAWIRAWDRGAIAGCVSQ